MVNRFANRILQFNGKRTAIYLFLFSVVLRYSYSVFAYLNGVIESFKDDNYYYQFAKLIVKQGKIFFNTGQVIHDAIGPGLPWINAFTIFVFGENWLGIFFITSVVSGLITLFTYKVALLVVDKASALLAGLWSCFYLFYFQFSPTSGKDIWMAFLLILLIHLLIKLFSEKKFSYTRFVIFVFVYVFSFHLDERYLMFAPFIFLYILISETSYFSSIKFTKSVLFVFLVLLFMLPWSIRNYKKHDKVVLISTRTERLTDKLLGYESRDLPFDYITNLYGPYYIHDYQIDSVLTGKKTITDGGFKIKEVQRKAMINGKLPYPFTFAEAFWVRTKVMLRPFQIGGEYQKTGYFYYRKSFQHNMASLLFYGIIFLFAIPGFFYLYKKNRNIFYLFLSIILIYTLIHSFFVPWTTWRYRLPLDSLFIIVGCFGLVHLYKMLYVKLKNQKYPLTINL